VIQRDDERGGRDRHAARDREPSTAHRPKGLDRAAAVEQRDEAQQRDKGEQGPARELRGRVDRERPLQQAGRGPRQRGQGDEELPPAAGVRIVGRPRHRRQSTTARSV
jgi:hypothetical protein